MTFKVSVYAEINIFESNQSSHLYAWMTLSFPITVVHFFQPSHHFLEQFEDLINSDIKKIRSVTM